MLAYSTHMPQAAFSLSESGNNSQSGNMLSSRCSSRNQTIIPRLLNQHDAVLSGNMSVIDLSTAENWSVKSIVLEMMREAKGCYSEDNLAYTSGIGGCPNTRSLLANLLNNHFHPTTQVDSSQIILAAGGSFALTALVEQICNPGDGILIAAPYWAGLDISISIHGHASIIPVHMPLWQFFSPESVQYYESALENASMPIKAILVCNPHNPLGQCYPRETLHALLDFCRRHDLHYISDEVYALSAHHPQPVGCSPFVSILQLGESHMSENTHVIYSLSKDFGCNGIRLGALISQSNKAVRLSAALSLHSQVSSLSTTFASETILREDSIRRICEHGGKRLRRAYEVMTLFLKTREMEFIPGAYGMFVFARLYPVKTIEEEQRLLGNLKSMGVSVSTGTSYHFEELGWFRICYGVPLDQLDEALRRIHLGVLNYAKVTSP